MKTIFVFAIICFILVRAEVAPVNELQVAIDNDWGRCCHQHYVFSVVSDCIMSVHFIQSSLNGYLSIRKNALKLARELSSDIWITAHYFNDTNSSFYPNYMSHKTPANWAIPASLPYPFSGISSNICYALKTLGESLSCHDNINYQLIVWNIWSSLWCNDPIVINNFHNAYKKWTQCGCRLSRFRIISVWNLLDSTTKRKAEEASLLTKLEGTPLQEILDTVQIKYSYLQPLSTSEFSKYS